MKNKILVILSVIAIITTILTVHINANMFENEVVSLQPIQTEPINDNNSYPFDFELLATDETTAFISFTSLYANHTLYLAKKGEDINISGLGQTDYMLELYTEYVFDYTYIQGDERISYGGKLIVHDIDGKMLLKYREIAVNTSYNRDITEDVLSNIMSVEPLVAGRRTETEDNGTASTADVTYDDYDNYGAITSDDDVDIWRVYFDTDGSANFWLGNIPSNCDYDITVYQGAINSAYIVGTGTNSSNTNELVRCDISAYEYYYIKIESASNFSASQYLFRTKITATSSSGDSYEPNNSIASAEGITTTVISDATIHSSSDVDWFAFYVESIGSLTVTLSNIPTGCDYDIRLYDQYLKQIASSSLSGTTNEIISFSLTADGWYYVYISSYDGYSNSSYRLTISSYESTTPVLAFRVTDDTGTPIQGAKVYVYCPKNDDLFDGNDMPIHIGSTTDSNGYVFIDSVSFEYPNSDVTDSYNVWRYSNYGVNITTPNPNNPEYAQYSFPNRINASYTVYEVVMQSIDSYVSFASPFGNGDVTPPSILLCQNFGWRYGLDSDVEFHTGADILYVDNERNTGDGVYSISNGEVVYNNFRSQCGNMVTVKYSTSQEDYYIHYMHLQSKSTLTVGSQISQGDLIGYVGGTYTSSSNVAPHLHLTIATANVVNEANADKYIDPTAFIKTWEASQN